MKLRFYNKVINKYQLKQIVVWAFRNYGIARAANMVDKLKDIGFSYATKGGISLSLEDLRIPPVKNLLLKKTLYAIELADNKHKRGEITAVERFQKVIDTWNNASETLKKEVIQHFKDTDPLNSIYMMAFSGARGNISQVRQLVGMRGLMSDPRGQIIDLPISSNFREGLSITDYFISSYGARKGLVDTALRTADSGYLTRRLVDVAQDIIVRENNCKTSKGILLETMVDNQKALISLKQALIGRVLAEDLINPYDNSIIAYADQSIDESLADIIVKCNYQRVLVRSPITCNSIKSICQMCYGWNLAHGRMVDIGEAVGIIAAQSIGEPGTQLTMRTFHTGGVFTGELTQTIDSPFNGTIHYLQDMFYSVNRTRHGEPAFLIKSDCKLQITDTEKKDHFIFLSKGVSLLVEDGCYVQQGQVIAEYPLNYRIITERAQKKIDSNYAGSVHLTSLQIEKNLYRQSTLYKAYNDGVLWVLSSNVYNIPDSAQLMITHNQKIYEDSLIARTQFVTNYSGYVQVMYNEDDISQIAIVTSSKTFSNIRVYKTYVNGYDKYILKDHNQDKFLLKIKPNHRLQNKQIIGDLLCNVYKTSTGGIIKYLDLPTSKRKIDINDEYYEILDSGYILWIPEETHEINKDISLLLVNNGDFIDVGTEIIKNVFSNNAGIIEIIQRDGIVREVIIKPGKIYMLDEHHLYKSLGKYRGFLRPGQVITQDIVIDKLVYWEYMQVNNQDKILVRPVIVYSVPFKSLSSEYTESSFGTDMFNIKIMRRTRFRDGARIKSIHGVNLVTTHLVTQLHDKVQDLYCYIEFITKTNNLESSNLKVITADFLSLSEIDHVNDKSFYIKYCLQVNNEQYVKNGDVIYQTEILSSIEGTIELVEENQLSSRRISVISATDTRIFNIKNEQLINVKVNDWIYAGDEIATNLITCYSGKVLTIKDNLIIIRIGQPYLISQDSVLSVRDKSLIKLGENIATLIFERAKTGDIVQGLPRIEEILEARKKSDSLSNPHMMLEMSFKSFLQQGLSLYDATRLSFLQVQMFLIKEIQLVYQAQGVDIADKHIEVIVRQMTSKVKIENGGETGFLPGEMLELHKIETVNISLSLINKKTASYYPILLGITKASLNTDSFISAASFQETTKVLTQAAISGKLDWLRGLKENVIIGRLIPAGTGFNIYGSSMLSHELNIAYNKYEETKLSQKPHNNMKSKINFEDIILDDRSARNYPDMVQ